MGVLKGDSGVVVGLWEGSNGWVVWGLDWVNVDAVGGANGSSMGSG